MFPLVKYMITFMYNAGNEALRARDEHLTENSHAFPISSWGVTATCFPGQGKRGLCWEPEHQKVSQLWLRWCPLWTPLNHWERSHWSSISVPFWVSVVRVQDTLQPAISKTQKMLGFHPCSEKARMQITQMSSEVLGSKIIQSYCFSDRGSGCHSG